MDTTHSANLNGSKKYNKNQTLQRSHGLMVSTK